MYMKRIRLLSFAAALILILTIACRVGTQIYGNYQKKSSFAFNSNSYNPYKRGVSMDEMDLTDLDYYLSIAMTAESTRVSNTIALPKKITYYKQQGGKMVPALELPEGTTILWIPTKELNDFSPGYGLRSYPTYEKGWRYAKPFMVSGKETDYRYLPFYYYVRTSDLELVAKKAIRSTKPLMSALLSKRLSFYEGAFTYTRFIDHIFYDKGVFNSPDLIRPIWQSLDTAMLCLSIALLLLPLYIQKKQKDSMQRVLNHISVQADTLVPR